MMASLLSLQLYKESAKKRTPLGPSEGSDHAKKKGGGEVGASLQDLYFRTVSPAEYHQTKQKVGALLRNQGMSVEEIIGTIGGMLSEERICVLDIHGRVKGIYSTYLKFSKYNKDVPSIHDLIAVRIIVDDIDTCYYVLKVIESGFIPIAGRLKDYIANPKRNGYQSLHSTFKMGETGMFEVQIRTGEMHAQAEIGSAAHWAYDLVKSSQRIMDSILVQQLSP